MKLKNFLIRVFGGLFLACLVSCGPMQFGSTVFETDDDTNDTFEDTLLKGVTEITFDGENRAIVDLSEIEKDGTYVVALYSYDEGNQVYSFQLGEAVGESRALGLLASPSGDMTDDFHGTLRMLEEDLVDEDPVETSGGRFLVKAASVGSTETFKVMNSLSSAASYDVVTAELRYANSRIYVYVDVRNENALTDGEIEEIAENFDEALDNERDLFGDESDVNGDGHFAILMTQAVNELGGSGGGIITGFFYGVDLYSGSSYPISNQMEVIYTMVPDPTGEFGAAISKSFSLSNILPAVLPHEYQHMISYNQHVFQNKGLSEESWLNEGLAHLAEDIYSISASPMEESGIDNPARVAYYLKANEATCFTCGSSLAQRGGSYLFLRYLFEQAEKGNLSGVSSGSELINRLLDTSLTGIDNLLDSTLDTSSENGLKFLLGRFTLALYLSNTGLTTDSRYQVGGINLRGKQDDNRGTLLDGPKVTKTSLPFSGTVVSSGISYISISGADLMATGGTLPVALSSDMQGGGLPHRIERLIGHNPSITSILTSS